MGLEEGGLGFPRGRLSSRLHWMDMTLLDQEGTSHSDVFANQILWILALKLHLPSQGPGAGLPASVHCMVGGQMWVARHPFLSVAVTGPGGHG